MMKHAALAAHLVRIVVVSPPCVLRQVMTIIVNTPTMTRSKISTDFIQTQKPHAYDHFTSRFFFEIPPHLPQFTIPLLDADSGRWKRSSRRPVAFKRVGLIVLIPTNPSRSSCALPASILSY